MPIAPEIAIKTPSINNWPDTINDKNVITVPTAVKAANTQAITITLISIIIIHQQNSAKILLCKGVD